MRVYRHADAESDHYLQVANVKLKLAKIFNNNQNKIRRKFDTGKLKHDKIKEEFALELKNWFDILGEVQLEDRELMQNNWNNFKQIYNQTAEVVLGFKKKTKSHGLKKKLGTK